MANKIIEKIDKKKVVSTIFVIIYFFRQLVFYINPNKGYFLVGNLDIFYLFGIIYLIFNFKKIKSKEVIFFLLLFCFSFFQIIVIDDINILRIFINVFKIFVSFFVMKYTIKNIKRVDLVFITKLYSFFTIIFLICAFIFDNSNILWRYNDTVNVFDLDRLKLLYTEPGELGFHCSIIMIIAFGLLKTQKNKISYTIFTIIPLIVTLYFTKSLGGIGVGLLGILVLYFADMCFNFNIKKLSILIGIIFGLIILLMILKTNNSSLYLRVNEIFDNHDSSTRYRIAIPFQIVPQILKDTNGLGVGFGNLELETNVEKYSGYGLEKAGIINSFMNLIAESGIIGIFITIILIYKLLIKSFKSKSSLKMALAFFIIVYQFMGTYFTNPLCWVIYGLIFSNNKEFIESTRLDEISTNEEKI